MGVNYFTFLDELLKINGFLRNWIFYKFPVRSVKFIRPPDVLSVGLRELMFTVLANFFFLYVSLHVNRNHLHC